MKYLIINTGSRINFDGVELPASGNVKLDDETYAKVSASPIYQGFVGNGAIVESDTAPDGVEAIDPVAGVTADAAAAAQYSVTSGNNPPPVVAEGLVDDSALTSNATGDDKQPSATVGKQKATKVGSGDQS